MSRFSFLLFFARRSMISMSVFILLFLFPWSCSQNTCFRDFSQCGFPPLEKCGPRSITGYTRFPFSPSPFFQKCEVVPCSIACWEQMLLMFLFPFPSRRSQHVFCALFRGVSENALYRLSSKIASRPPSSIPGHF